MMVEDEAFIKRWVDQEMERFGQSVPSFGSDLVYRQNALLVEAQDHMIDDLRLRLEKANATIRSANRRIEELKTANTVPLSNPDFVALGLDPNTAFVGLSEDQIVTFVTGMQRLLAKIYHPDVGGNTERMRTIILAADNLKNPTTRNLHKR